MAGIGTRRGWIARGALPLLAAALLCPPLAAQANLSLEQAGARDPAADYAPRRLNQEVAVRGVVNASAFRFPGYTILSIEDGNFGAVLKVGAADSRLNGYRPGDDLRVRGRIAVLAGMAVIEPAEIEKIGVRAAPSPVTVSIQDLIGFRYLGRLVRTEVKVSGLGDTANGAYVVAEASERFLVFIPRAENQPVAMPLTKGDLAHVTGVAFQYSPRPPFNRYFQLLAQDTSAIVPFPARWMPPPAAIGAAMGMALLIGCLVWARERRARRQRERLRRTYQLGEEILAATSSATILKRLRETLPEILNVTRVRVFVHNRAAKALESVAAEGEAPLLLPLTPPSDQAASAAVWCFEYHSLLAIPDIERSPFAAGGEGGAPKSLLCVPMLAQAETAGVLQLEAGRGGAFTEDEQQLAQHLANQAGVAIRLMEQRSVQEQLFRTEKLAAVGRLISGVVNELQAPLESIEELAKRAMGKAVSAAADRDLAAIAGEARKASNIVTRLVSYASSEQGNARPVPVGELLRGLIQFREGDWKASGIRVRDLTSGEPMAVLGSREQLEQVLLNLLVHAEQSLAESPRKIITIRASILAKRLLVEIAFTGRPVSGNPAEIAAILGVTRSVIAGHGGELRLIEKSNTDPRFEVELPLIAAERAAAPKAAARGRDPKRQLTALVIDPEESTERQLLALLAARGFRVVPVDNADKGLDLAHRVRFDAAFCSVHAPGLNWVELSERMQPLVGAFVLLAERHDSELAADFEGENRFVAAKPFGAAELDRILQSLDAELPVVKNGAA